MEKQKLTKNLHLLETEKICQLLECKSEEIDNFFEDANEIALKHESTYKALLSILQKGCNIREATLVAILYGQLIGYKQAEAKIEEEMKERLYNAFKNNSRF